MITLYTCVYNLLPLIITPPDKKVLWGKNVFHYHFKGRHDFPPHKTPLGGKYCYYQFRRRHYLLDLRSRTVLLRHHFLKKTLKQQLLFPQWSKSKTPLRRKPIIGHMFFRCPYAGAIVGHPSKNGRFCHHHVHASWGCDICQFGPMYCGSQNESQNPYAGPRTNPHCEKNTLSHPSPHNVTIIERRVFLPRLTAFIEYAPTAVLYNVWFESMGTQFDYGSGSTRLQYHAICHDVIMGMVGKKSTTTVAVHHLIAWRTPAL